MDEDTEPTWEEFIESLPRLQLPADGMPAVEPGARLLLADDQDTCFAITGVKSADEHRVRVMRIVDHCTPPTVKGFEVKRVCCTLERCSEGCCHSVALNTEVTAWDNGEKVTSVIRVLFHVDELQWRPWDKVN